MQQQGVAGYEAFGGVFFVIIALFSVLCSLALLSSLKDKYKKGHVDQSTMRRPSVVDKDNRNVLDNIGQEPFYCFFLRRESLWLDGCLGCYGLADMDCQHICACCRVIWKFPRDLNKCDDKADLLH
eukprot:scaffold363_cov209-Alexandrium_tamarense.AAC.2